MAMIKSTKTTVGGWIAFLTLALAGLASLLDGDPSTNPDASGIVEHGQAIGLFGAAIGSLIIGLFGRDDNVSSEGQAASKSE